MPDRPNFPIPDELTPDTFCLCLQIPNNEIWKQVFAGLLAQPMYWFNWQRDPDHSGKILSQYWQTLFDQIDWSNMSCCCAPLLRRLNPDGSMSTSSDGGATWQDAGANDPRNQETQFPPLPGTSPDDIKCKSANSTVRQLKDQQAGYSSKIGVITTIAEMAASLVGLAVLVFFDPALAPFLIGAFFELAAALLATTQTAYNALFTDDDWSWVLCELYNKMDNTGTIAGSDFITIQADFDSHFSGNAALTFSSILNSWQLAGLNAAARIGTTDNLDCSGCACPDDCPTEWTFFGVHDVVNTECSEWTMTSDGGGAHVAGTTGDISQGCYVNFHLLGSFSFWPVGSGSPVGGTNPGVTPIWNYDLGAPGAGDTYDFNFSSSPMPP